MRSATPKEMIDIDDLRVGMFVHLDMSWMSHPFPLGNFKVTDAEQLATIRELGLQRVRWSPALSDPIELLAPVARSDAPPTGAPTDAAAGAAAGTAAGAAAPASADPAATPLGAAAPAPDPAAIAAIPAIPAIPAISATAATAAITAIAPAHFAPRSPAAPGAPESAETPERAEQRRHLAAQSAALQLCERQFAEAAHACKQLTDAVASRPQDARTQAEQLSKALLDKMLGEHDLCIRLLTEAAGDKASQHALNVTVISLLMGRTFGLAEADMLDLGVGAMLHDIGKIDLPERVRHREEHFSSSETRFYEEHVAHGVTHARKMGLSGGATLVIAQHHEHADGSGFPLRLNTDRMTAASRIVSLVNRYDNLCNPNLASKALTPHESLSLLFAQGRTKFDTAILGAFIRMMGVYPAGSLVQLTDDRYAMVVGVNSSRPLKPRVLVHEAKVARDEALILDLETSNGIGIRRSLRPAQLPVAALEYLAPRPRVAYFFEPLELVQAAALAA
jgi:putative nucleotidyltransferase with HDIG domain